MHTWALLHVLSTLRESLTLGKDITRVMRYHITHLAHWEQHLLHQLNPTQPREHFLAQLRQLNYHARKIPTLITAHLHTILPKRPAIHLATTDPFLIHVAQELDAKTLTVPTHTPAQLKRDLAANGRTVNTSEVPPPGTDTILTTCASINSDGSVSGATHLDDPRTIVVATRHHYLPNHTNTHPFHGRIATERGVFASNILAEELSQKLPFPNA